MELALQFVGALGILVPFALLQFRRTTAQSGLYLSLNLAGAAILTWLALVESQWGFVILQGVWALAGLRGVAPPSSPRTAGSEPELMNASVSDPQPTPGRAGAEGGIEHRPAALMVRPAARSARRLSVAAERPIPGRDMLCSARQPAPGRAGVAG